MNVNLTQLFYVECGFVKELGGVKYFKEITEKKQFDFVLRDEHPRAMTLVFAREALARMTERQVLARIVRADNLEPAGEWNLQPTKEALTLGTNWQQGCYHRRHPDGRYLQYDWTLNRSLSTYYARLGDVSVSAPTLDDLWTRLVSTPAWSQLLNAFVIAAPNLTAPEQPAAPVVPENVPTIEVTAGQSISFSVRPGSAR
jgi:hypothetical protein